MICKFKVKNLVSPPLDGGDPLICWPTVDGCCFVYLLLILWLDCPLAIILFVIILCSISLTKSLLLSKYLPYYLPRFHLCLRCYGLLDILEKIKERPFNLDHGDIVNIPSEEELGDVVKCTSGLIRLFTVKMYQLPSSQVVQIYKTLVRHANLHYEKPIYFEFAFSTKLAVFDFILNITADSIKALDWFIYQFSCVLNDFFVCPFLGEYRLGYAPLTRYSPYISKDHKHGARVGGTSRKEIQSGVEDSGATVHNNVTQMSLGEACVAVIRCLSHERDWRVLKLVLEG